MLILHSTLHTPQDTIKVLVKKGQKNLMLVPIAFVNDHIETLHELDIEYAQDIGKEVGAERIARCATPNVDQTFIDCLADIVATHLKSGQSNSSLNYQLFYDWF